MVFKLCGKNYTFNSHTTQEATNANLDLITEDKSVIWREYRRVVDTKISIAVYDTGSNVVWYFISSPSPQKRSNRRNYSLNEFLSMTRRVRILVDFFHQSRVSITIIIPITGFLVVSETCNNMLSTSNTCQYKGEAILVAFLLCSKHVTQHSNLIVQWQATNNNRIDTWFNKEIASCVRK